MSYNFFRLSASKISWFTEITEDKQLYNDVDNPKHYIEGRKFEPAWVINDWCLDWDLGTCVKYISRLGRKDAKSKDIKKALWYIIHEISLKYKDITEEELIDTIKNIYSKEKKYEKISITK